MKLRDRVKNGMSFREFMKNLFWDAEDWFESVTQRFSGRMRN